MKRKYEVWIDTEDADRLDRVCTALDISRADFIRGAVLNQLGRIAGERVVTIETGEQEVVRFADQIEIGQLVTRVTQLLDKLEGSTT